MSDSERDSQLSAMFDGELPAAECELVARRLARDPRLKRQWASYSLIGAVIRGEPVQAAGHAPAREESRLSRKVSEAIASEAAGSEATGVAPVAVSVAPEAPDVPRWQRPLAGLGIAAAVAGLAVFGLQFRSPPAAPELARAAAPVEDEVVIPMMPVADSESAASARSTEPESYIVPVGGDTRVAAAVPSPQLANFVVAHSEYSAPWARRNLLSSILASEIPENPGTAADSVPAAPPVPVEPERR